MSISINYQLFYMNIFVLIIPNTSSVLVQKCHHCFFGKIPDYFHSISACSNHNCTSRACLNYRKRSVYLSLSKEVIGFIGKGESLRLFEDFLESEHLYPRHILRLQKPKRSKFLVQFACPRDLLHLFRLIIFLSIKNNNTEIIHNGYNDYVTIYGASLPEAVGSFIHPRYGKLYQFTVAIMFRNGVFVNAHPTGKGYHVKKIDPEKDERLQPRSYSYPSGPEYRTSRW